ncbi:MAG: hypothetical protein AB7U18_10415 [Dehalococcoidia bacterium]
MGRQSERREFLPEQRQGIQFDDIVRYIVARRREDEGGGLCRVVGETSAGSMENVLDQMVERVPLTR